MARAEEIRPVISTSDPGITESADDALRPSIRTGLPPDTKLVGQTAYHKPDLYDKTVVAHGWRMWWQKAVLCPCRGNDQTEQANPLCPRCRGRGWLYALPDANLSDGGSDNAGNAVELNSAGDAVAIQAILSSMTLDPQVYERMGQWIFGSCRVTTFRHNKLGYADRLTLRDATVAYSQLLDSNGEQEIHVLGKRSLKGLWSPVDSVTHLRSDVRTYEPGSDFIVTDSGTIVWKIDPPEVGTRLALAGHFRPRLVVQDHVFVDRAEMVRQKTATQGYQALPARANCKLEFLSEV